MAQHGRTVRKLQKAAVAPVVAAAAAAAEHAYRYANRLPGRQPMRGALRNGRRAFRPCSDQVKTACFLHVLQQAHHVVCRVLVRGRGEAEGAKVRGGVEGGARVRDAPLAQQQQPVEARKQLKRGLVDGGDHGAPLLL